MNKLLNKKKELSIWKIAIPYIFMVALNFGIQQINALIARYNGTVVSTGVNVAGQVIGPFGLVLDLFVSGVVVFCAQYVGAKKTEKIKPLVSTSRWIGLGVSIFTITLLAIFGTQLMGLYGIKGKAPELPHAEHYLYLMLSTLLINAYANTTGSIIYASGKAAVMTVISISTALLDVGISALLVIFAHMGAYGVAIGTICGRIVAVCCFMIYIRRKIVKISWLPNVFDKKISKDLFRVSAPIAGEKVNYTISQAILGMIIGSIGLGVMVNKNDPNPYQATRGYIMLITTFNMLFAIGLQMGASVVSGQLLGKGRANEAQRITIKALIWGIIIDVCIAGILCGVGGLLMKLLVSDLDSHYQHLILNATKWILIIFLFLEIGRAANIIILGTLRAAGYMTPIFVFSLFSTWILAIGLGYLLGQTFHMGIVGIFIAMATDEIARGAFAFIVFMRGKWKNSKLEKHKSEEVDHNHDSLVSAR